MTMSRIKDQDVYIGLYKGGSPVKYIVCNTDSGGTQQPALSVSSSVGVNNGLFYILNCNKAL